MAAKVAAKFVDEKGAEIHDLFGGPSKLDEQGTTFVEAQNDYGTRSLSHSPNLQQTLTRLENLKDF
jgi:hypothetical protein